MAFTLTKDVMTRMEKEAEQLIMKARVQMITKSELAFFGSLAMRLELRSNWTIPTCATDGFLIHYNPSFLLSLPKDETISAIAHEVLHAALMHPLRRGMRDPQKWNIAADYADNLLLQEAHLKINTANGWLLDTKWTGMTAEEIYDKLPDPPESDGGDEGKDGQGGGNGDGPPQDGSKNPFSSKSKGCSSIKDPKDANGESLSPGEAARREAQAKQLVAESYNSAKLAGSIPAGLQRVIDKMLHPKVPYKELLRQFLDRWVRDDYSWVKPNKRFIGQGVYLPVLQSQEVGEIVVVVDTSGSMGQKELDLCGAEVSGVLESGIVSKVHVLYVDAAVAGHEEYTKHDTPIRLTPHGGGGTDFVPAFNWVAENGIHPAALIYCTDLCCDSYPPVPDYPTLWVKIGSWGSAAPPFGEVVATIDE
jgi:predicted metal-dependent peptidase